MPNIKIYGVSIGNLTRMYEDIKKIFENEPYAEHIVITHMESVVYNLEAEKQPYIQLELNCMKNYEQKVEKLKQLKMDIQVVKLHDFIPKE